MEEGCTLNRMDCTDLCSLIFIILFAIKFVRSSFSLITIGSGIFLYYGSIFFFNF